MRAAGAILVGLGVVLIAAAFASHVFGMVGAFGKVREDAGYVQPGELAGEMHRILGRSVLLGGPGLLSLAVGLPLLIVGVIRAAGKGRNGAGPPFGE